MKISWKKLIAVPLAVTLAFGGVVATTPSIEAEASEYSFSKKELEYLAEVNKVRKAVGLKEVKLNPYLSKAAQNHADYLFIHGSKEGHLETKGKKGYTGDRAYKRAEAVGLDEVLLNGVGEVINYDGTNAKESVDGFMLAPYHRVILLDPFVSEIGVGYSEPRSGSKGTHVVTTLSKGAEENKPVFYPYENQSGVDIGFYGFEEPNPLEQFNIEKSGYVISFLPDGDWVDDHIATIKDSKGNNVPFYEEDFGLLYLFPKSELKYNEKYTVTVKYNGKSKTWSFTTKSGTGTTPTTPVTPKPSEPTPKIVYADYRADQYWSKNMLWAIEKGLIGGYAKCKESKNR